MNGPGHDAGAWRNAQTSSTCAHCGYALPASAARCPQCGRFPNDDDALTVLGDTPAPTPAVPPGTTFGNASENVTRFVAPSSVPDDVTRMVAPADASENVTRFVAPAADSSADETRFVPADSSDDETRFETPEDALTVATPVTPPSHKPRPRRGSDTGPLEVGQSFGPRYHIIRMLGVGGMGAVYQAWDAELGVAVAIKVIRPEVMEDPVMAEEVSRRFKRELLLARQVTHKNVVRIHDIGDIDGIKYITMSYVEGTDLATILKRDGKRPVPELLHIARGVINGLVAAHTAGVVHRDLKPANIMIGKEGDPLIMDFGIAHSTGDPSAAPAPGAGVLPEHLRRAASHQAATTVGSIVGTVEYMAPEQAKGLPIDQRADVYAFGLILYDAFLGQRRAASGASAVEELQRRMTSPPPPLHALAPDVPPPLAALIARCVEPEAEKRFQTSAEVAAELDRLDDEGKLIPIARRLTKRMVVLTTLLVSALLGGAVYVTRQAAKPEEQHEPVKLIIADIANPTRNAAFSGTLEPMIRLALEETGFISAYDRTQIRALGLPPIKGSLGSDAARQIAFQQGLGVVITGEIRSERGGFALDLKAAESVSGKVITTASERFGLANEVLSAMNRAATTVREALGDEVSDSAKRFAMETLSVTSLEAVAEYAKAMEALANGAPGQAKTAALKAIALDSNFGSAYGVAAIAARNMRNEQEAGQYIQLAIEHLGSMTSRERLRTRGFSAELKGNYEKCAEEYGNLIARYYADASAHNNLAVCLTQLRQMRKAVDEVQKAAAILPNRVLYRANAAIFAAYASDFPPAERAATEALKLNPSYTYGIFARAFAQLGQGKVPDAIATYRELEKVSRSDGIAGLADVALYEGRFGEAIATLQDGIAADLAAKNVDRAADKLVALGYAELMRGNQPATIAAASRALINSTSPKIRFLTGRLFSEAGDQKRAQSQAEALGSGLEVLSQAYSKIVQGDIALHQGDPRRAVALLTEANKLRDTWIGRFDLGRAYLAADAFLEAESEFDTCIERRGEAMALGLDEVPTFGYFPPVHYYIGRARQGLGTSNFVDSYRAYLDVRGKADQHPLLVDVRRLLRQ